MRSDSFPEAYTMDAAQGLLDKYPQMLYRIAEIPRKAYRRHAAVTPLELRGAKAMLESALKHNVHIVRMDFEGSKSAYDAWSILMAAKLECVRALEAM